MRHRFLQTASLSLITSFLDTLSAWGQTKIFGQYREWPNTFHNNGTSTFSPGTGSNPQSYEAFKVPSGNLWGYPATIRGYHYGYNPANDKLSPKEMSTISSIPAAFSYASTQNDGRTTPRGDFTYDLFLRNDNGTSGNNKNPELEVMIWGGNASYPIPSTGSPFYTSVYSADGYTWDLYYGYTESMYQDVVEAGCEITQGGWFDSD
jgi:Glycosyl hydrolase family 12